MTFRISDFSAICIAISCAFFSLIPLISARRSAASIDKLCKSFREAKAEVDPLLLDIMFVLDFLCIHPFNDGNGRMSRLITLLLLYQSGFIVGKYISIEKIIEESKETYYEVLQDSSINWHENQNDYKPFVNYMLGVIINAYREFETRVKLVTDSDLSKPDRIREIMKNHIGMITKSELMEMNPRWKLLFQKYFQWSQNHAHLPEKALFSALIIC